MDPRDESGFTLVEVIVALALFVIVATASTFAIVGSIRASHATDLRVAATAIAQQELDHIRVVGANPTPAPQPVGDDPDFTTTITPTPAWDVDCAIGTAHSYRDVEVSVEDAAGQITPVVLDARLACKAGGS
jgi:prepilin-type N-terminal cleavage/methylation domain-containing protein